MCYEIISWMYSLMTLLEKGRLTAYHGHHDQALVTLEPPILSSVQHRWHAIITIYIYTHFALFTVHAKNEL